MKNRRVTIDSGRFDLARELARDQWLAHRVGAEGEGAWIVTMGRPSGAERTGTFAAPRERSTSAHVGYVYVDAYSVRVAEHVGHALPAFAFSRPLPRWTARAIAADLCRVQNLRVAPHLVFWRPFDGVVIARAGFDVLDVERAMVAPEMRGRRSPSPASDVWTAAAFAKDLGVDEATLGPALADEPSARGAMSELGKRLEPGVPDAEGLQAILDVAWSDATLGRRIGWLTKRRAIPDAKWLDVLLESYEIALASTGEESTLDAWLADTSQPRPWPKEKRLESIASRAFSAACRVTGKDAPPGPDLTPAHAFYLDTEVVWDMMRGPRYRSPQPDPEPPKPDFDALVRDQCSDLARAFPQRATSIIARAYTTAFARPSPRVTPPPPPPAPPRPPPVDDGPSLLGPWPHETPAEERWGELMGVVYEDATWDSEFRMSPHDTSAARAAFVALGAAAVPVARRWLDHRDERVRFQALRAIIELGPVAQDAFRQLAQRFDRTKGLERAWLAEALHETNRDRYYAEAFNRDEATALSTIDWLVREKASEDQRRFVHTLFVTGPEDVLRAVLARHPKLAAYARPSKKTPKGS